MSNWTWFGTGVSTIVEKVAKEATKPSNVKAAKEIAKVIKKVK